MLVYIYNYLVQLKQEVDEAWSDIGVQLKRRSDLIPNIIETVKGYAAHEKQVFEDVTAARTKFLSAQTPKEQMDADNQFSQTLKSLFAVAENYPDLKANQNFLELQAELRDAEDKIQAARRFYNSVVRDYNTAFKVFPNNLFVQTLKFKPYDFFEINDQADTQVPKVQF
ncbi:MAG: LemA family protein [Patescibacteria group bacterium]|nr:LemA family protein [Patescibacteria group bacterium]MCL5258055.1 LemA family protein [Patescibacteria group bacterium]